MTMKILLADDDAALRKVIQYKLKQRGYDVTAVEDGEEALFALRGSQFDLLLTDMRMPKVNGIELLEKAKEIQPNLEVILMTAYAAVSQAVEAVKLGAFDYLTKPFDYEQLFVTIEKAVKFKKLEEENLRLREQLREKKTSKIMIGVSVQHRSMMELIDKIAASDATVLITGESGTGKELIARLIHEKSARVEMPFVAVNCAAIPRDLLESELFGYVRGAFTGANRDKKGKFELAEGGTIFLDEISELSIDLQAKLLRVLQERIIEPLGSEQRIAIDVRILASSNVILRDRIAAGQFREDLYYRLAVIPLHTIPLREKKEDIVYLARHYLDKIAPGQGIEMSKDLIGKLFNHSWPGNVRELENLMERMVALRNYNELTLADLPPDFEQPAGAVDRKPAFAAKDHLTFHEAEKELIVDALVKCAWNRTRAAEYLNIPRHVLIYRMKKYQIIVPTRAGPRP